MSNKEPRRVRVMDNCGPLSGKEGIRISRKEIPLNDKGIPNIPGYVNPLQPHEVGVKEDCGNIFITYSHNLKKIPADDSEKEK